MLGFKGFNKDLSCTQGKGTFRYEIGKTYKEDKAQTASAGFHFVEEPIEVIRWYPEGKYFAVKAEGDIDEDAGKKLSCTEITLLKELSKEQLVVMEIQYLIDHMGADYSTLVKKDKAESYKGIAIAVGKDPVASGSRIGDIIGLLKTGENTEATVLVIDGKDYKPFVYYKTDGAEVENEKR